MSCHASAHIDARWPSEPLVVRQAGGRKSVEISSDSITVWLTGTPAELQTFALRLTETVHGDKVVGCETSPGLAAEPDVVEGAAAPSANHEAAL